MKCESPKRKLGQKEMLYRKKKEKMKERKKAKMKERKKKKRKEKKKEIGRRGEETGGWCDRKSGSMGLLRTAN